MLWISVKQIEMLILELTNEPFSWLSTGSEVFEGPASTSCRCGWCSTSTEELLPARISFGNGVGTEEANEGITFLSNLTLVRVAIEEVWKVTE